jgi:hypothetical protein
MPTTPLHDLAERLKARRGLPLPDGLRALREACDLSQADVAFIVGCHRTLPGKWEAGRPIADEYVPVVQSLVEVLAEALARK